MKKKFDTEEIMQIFKLLCSNFLTSSTLITGVHYILVGESLIGEEKPAILPVISPGSNAKELKALINDIIEETSRKVLYKSILCFDVEKDVVKGSIENIGDGIVWQQILKNTQTEERFIDNKYQIFD